MWDQIRVDHGKEFYLSLFIQEMIEGYRNRRERQPYMQTQSTKVQYELNLHNIGKLWKYFSPQYWKKYVIVSLHTPQH